MLVSVIGAGYVGLVTAACLASLGHEVRCIENNEQRLAHLLDGQLPLAEPDLADLVRDGVSAHRLSFHGSIEETHGTELAIVAVGTLDEDSRWTADSVRQVVLALAADPEAPRKIVIRSTLMPTTSRDLASAARSVDQAVEVAHNPEFTREGSAVADFLSPDRVVIGVEDGDRDAPICRSLIDLYAPLGAPLVITDLASAETIKVGSNVFLATKIAYANELARLSAAAGADVQTVVDAIGLDRRIGRAFLSPGPGFGGACLPSQARELPAMAARLGVTTPLMDGIAPSNEEAGEWLLRRIETEMGGTVARRRVAVLGLTFKAGTDDLRESPAVRLAKLLGQAGAELPSYDPSGATRAVQLLADEGVTAMACESASQAASGADALLVATEWPEFRSLDWPAIAGVMRGRLIVDARNVINRVAANAAGLDVLVLGRLHPAATVGPRESVP